MIFKNRFFILAALAGISLIAVMGWSQTKPAKSPAARFEYRIVREYSLWTEEEHKEASQDSIKALEKMSQIGQEGLSEVQNQIEAYAIYGRALANPDNSGASKWDRKREAKLNAIGAEGWELISVSDKGEIFYFKRDISHTQ